MSNSQDNSQDKKKPFIIVSGKSLSQDFTQDLKLELAVSGLSCKEIAGVWKGISETSFIVTYDESQGDALSSIISLAFNEYKQIAILHVDSARKSTLVYADGTSEDLGSFENVTEKQAKDAESYSFDADFNRYYVTIGAK